MRYKPLLELPRSRSATQHALCTLYKQLYGSYRCLVTKTLFVSNKYFTNSLLITIPNKVTCLNKRNWYTNVYPSKTGKSHWVNSSAYRNCFLVLKETWHCGLSVSSQLLFLASLQSSTGVQQNCLTLEFIFLWKGIWKSLFTAVLSPTYYRSPDSMGHFSKTFWEPPHWTLNIDVETEAFGSLPLQLLDLQVPQPLLRQNLNVLRVLLNSTFHVFIENLDSSSAFFCARS